MSHGTDLAKHLPDAIAAGDVRPYADQQPTNDGGIDGEAVEQSSSNDAETPRQGPTLLWWQAHVGQQIPRMSKKEWRSKRKRFKAREARAARAAQAAQAAHDAQVDQGAQAAQAAQAAHDAQADQGAQAAQAAQGA